MTHLQFDEAVDRLVKHHKKIGALVEIMLAHRRKDDVQAANDVIGEIENECEKLTEQSRSLFYYTGHPRAKEIVEECMLNAVKVEIGFTREGWFVLKIPALLPKKEKGSADWIRGFLYPALRRFFADKPRVYYPDCVLIFRHIYDRRRSERQYRDHDNIELNAVVDIIAQFVLDGDMPLRCFHYYCSTAGDENRTEVYVVPQAEFTQWLDAEKNQKIEDVTLYDLPP